MPILFVLLILVFGDWVGLVAATLSPVQFNPKTKFPAMRPTMRPSKRPTMRPAKLPIIAPTIANPSFSPSLTSARPSLAPSLEPTSSQPSFSPSFSAPTNSPTLREDGVSFTLVFDNPNFTQLYLSQSPTMLPTSRRRPSTMLRTAEPTTSPHPILDEYEEENEYDVPKTEYSKPGQYQTGAMGRRRLSVVDLPNTNPINNSNLSPLVNWQVLYQGVHCLLDFLLLANNLAYSQFYISALPEDSKACNASFDDCFPLRIGVFIIPVGQVYEENATCIVPQCGKPCADSCVLATQMDSLVQANLVQTRLLKMGSTLPELINNGSMVEIRNLVFGLKSNDLYPSGRFCRDDYLDPTEMARVLHTLTQSPTVPDIDYIDQGPSPGLVVGISLSVFGAVLLVGITLAWYCLKRRTRMQKRMESDEEYAIDLSRLKLDRQVGSGSSSKIFIAHYEGSVVCIKEMRSGVNVGLLKREVDTLRILKHPHIIQLYGYAISTNQRFLIMMELMDTSLDRVIRERHTNTILDPNHWMWAMDVSRQIALALHFCHSKEVMHCDVKPANVLFKGSTVKLCDLGIAKLVNAKIKPENIQGHLSRKDIRIEILQHHQPKLHPELDPRIGRLICQAWDYNPELRPTFNEILSQLECIAPTDSPSSTIMERIGSDGDSLNGGDNVKWTSLSDVLTAVVRENKTQRPRSRHRNHRQPTVAPLDLTLSPSNSQVEHSFQYDGESFVFSNGLVVLPEHGDGPYDSSKIRRIALLGQGASGQVHSGVQEDTWEVVAVKEVSKFFDQQVRSQAKKEIEALGMLKHERIVGLRALYFNSSFASLSITMVLEFVLGGSLQRIVDYSKSPMDEASLVVIARDVVDALVFCRERGVVHLDIKPANILVSHTGRAKLADFGLAKLLNQDVANTFLGTACYMSPERARGEGYGFPADVWGLGLSLATAAMGNYPLPETRQFLLVEITDMAKEFTLPPQLSQAGRECILKCLAVNEHARPTPLALQADKWFTVGMPSSVATVVAEGESDEEKADSTSVAPNNSLPLFVLADFADKLIEDEESFESLFLRKQVAMQNLANQFELQLNQVLIVFQEAFERRNEPPSTAVTAGLVCTI
ncbi:hypothetical protein BASA81_002398 [Batrachochytrium salamandrivorans]|nr:hypothetical protein BASA81_002398 [Batrachochytrium salamandrivorans]